MALYTDEFYDHHQATWQSSASVLVPIVQELVDAASVLDVGCGTGTWAARFAACGAKEVVGVDGDYVDRTRLKIPEEQFRAHDLRQPLDLGRRFDLVISLEVGEHIPESDAGTFVQSLVRHAEVVFFSAAIPFQGGRGHVNEQWPAYWAERFARHDYRAIDCLRSVVWNDERVKWWYSQNGLLYATPAAIAARPALARAMERSPEGALALVHPDKYRRHADPERLRLGRLLKALPGASRNDAARLLKKLRR
jgi:2-polyprenyl-3-methyl-5-hydroxy-6-metoxy-1,4-benzoquinol methylase